MAVSPETAVPTHTPCFSPHVCRLALVHKDSLSSNPQPLVLGSKYIQ